MTARNADVGDDVVVTELMSRAGQVKIAGVFKCGKSRYGVENHDDTKISVVVVAGPTTLDKTPGALKILASGSHAGLYNAKKAGVLELRKLGFRTYPFCKSGSLGGDTKYCPPAERRSVLGYVHFRNIPPYAQIMHSCKKGEFEFWKFWESIDSREFDGDSTNLQREHLTKADVGLTACSEAAGTDDSLVKTRATSAGENSGSRGPIAIAFIGARGSSPVKYGGVLVRTVRFTLDYLALKCGRSA